MMQNRRLEAFWQINANYPFLNTIVNWKLFSARWEKT